MLGKTRAVINFVAFVCITSRKVVAPCLSSLVMVLALLSEGPAHPSLAIDLHAPNLELLPSRRETVHTASFLG